MTELVFLLLVGALVLSTLVNCTLAALVYRHMRISVAVTLRRVDDVDTEVADEVDNADWWKEGRDAAGDS